MIDTEIELRKLLTEYDARIRGEGLSGFDAAEWHEAFMEILVEIIDPQKLSDLLNTVFEMPPEGIRVVTLGDGIIKSTRSKTVSDDGILVRIRPSRLKYGRKVNDNETTVR